MLVSQPEESLAPSSSAVEVSNETPASTSTDINGQQFALRTSILFLLHTVVYVLQTTNFVSSIFQAFFWMALFGIIYGIGYFAFSLFGSKPHMPRRMLVTFWIAGLALAIVGALLSLQIEKMNAS